MEEINKLKQIYLQTQPPMGASEGFANILERLDRKESKRVFKSKFLFAGLLLLVIATISAGLLVNPQSEITKALKGVINNSVKTFIKPEATPIPKSKINTNSKKVAPTVTPKVTKNLTPSIPVNQGTQNAQEKRIQNPTQNDEVKGASTAKPTIVPPTQAQSRNANINSEDNRNENSTNNPSDDNPSSEKSNGKSKINSSL